jgi:hypothetical protein
MLSVTKHSSLLFQNVIDEEKKFYFVDARLVFCVKGDPPAAGFIFPGQMREPETKPESKPVSYSPGTNVIKLFTAVTYEFSL